MGRPRKDSIVNEALRDPEPVAPPVDVTTLKRCPKCGAKARPPYQDIHGNYRCHCDDDKCGFWDCMVYMSPDAAAQGWERAGGPNPT